MAQIGFGYGSEYQLLRYLGHHRQELEEIISKQIGEGKFEWEDFKYSEFFNFVYLKRLLFHFQSCHLCD